MVDRLGKLSCCAPTASWYRNCGRPGDPNFHHTWGDGLKACKHAAKLSMSTTAANNQIVTAFVCPKCAMIDRLGKLSCCAPGASWYQNCGRTSGSAFDHTWAEGFKACKHQTEAMTPPTTTRPFTVQTQAKRITSEQPSTSVQTTQAKATTATTTRPSTSVQSQAITVATPDVVPVCPKCAMLNALLSCCAPNATWYENCGTAGDSDFEHTWDEGLEACRNAERLPLAKTEVIRMLINQAPLFQQIIVVQNTSVHSSVANIYNAPAADSSSYDQLSPVVVIPRLFMVFLHMFVSLH